jgi:hypothetical protein
VRLIIAPPGGMGACWYWAEKMLGAQLALLLVEDLARLPVRPQHLTRKRTRPLATGITSRSSAMAGSFKTVQSSEDWTLVILG